MSDETRALPYHMCCDVEGARLFQLSDGRFQFLGETRIAPLMVGSGYVLVAKELCHLLIKLGARNFQHEPAIMWHRSTNTEYTSHVALKIEKVFASAEIGQLELEGDLLFSLNNEYLFVSPSLGHKLANSELRYLRFSLGLSMFG